MNDKRTYKIGKGSLEENLEDNILIRVHYKNFEEEDLTGVLINPKAFKQLNIQEVFDTPPLEPLHDLYLINGGDPDVALDINDESLELRVTGDFIEYEKQFLRAEAGESYATEKDVRGLRSLLGRYSALCGLSKGIVTFHGAALVNIEKQIILGMITDRHAIKKSESIPNLMGQNWILMSDSAVQIRPNKHYADVLSLGVDYVIVKLSKETRGILEDNYFVDFNKINAILNLDHPHAPGEFPYALPVIDKNIRFGEGGQASLVVIDPVFDWGNIGKPPKVIPTEQKALAGIIKKAWRDAISLDPLTNLGVDPTKIDNVLSTIFDYEAKYQLTEKLDVILDLIHPSSTRMEDLTPSNIGTAVIRRLKEHERTYFKDEVDREIEQKIEEHIISGEIERAVAMSDSETVSSVLNILEDAGKLPESIVNDARRVLDKLLK